MIKTTSNDVFTQTFFQVANDINWIHLETGIDWAGISKEQKVMVEKAHGNLYFKLHKAQDEVDAAWKAQDMKKFKDALDRWRGLWTTEVELWKRELS